MSLVGLLAGMVRGMRYERRSREAIATMTTERVDKVAREALLAMMGSGFLCHTVDRETPNNWTHGTDILCKRRDWRPRQILRMDDVFILGNTRRAWRDTCVLPSMTAMCITS